jgi:parvulin-like peptidyl-prolyl isomerase
MGNAAGAQLKQMDAARLKTVLGQAGTQVAERKLLLAAAAEAKIAVAPEEIQAALTEQYAQAGGETQFLEALKSNGVSPDFVKTTIQNDRIIQKFMEGGIFKGLEVTDADIEKAYGEDKTASVRHILLLTQGKTEAEKAEIKKKIGGILDRANKGEDFIALVKEHTEDPGSKENGGLYEDFGRGRMVKPFEDAAFTVPVGQVSGIVETTYGYHILKVEGRKKETLPLDQVKTQLQDEVKQQKRAAAYEKLMTELKAKAKFAEVKF